MIASNMRGEMSVASSTTNADSDTVDHELMDKLVESMQISTNEVGWY